MLGEWFIAAMRPVCPAKNIPPRLDKLNASPQTCLTILLRVWEISSLQMQVTGDRIIKRKPKVFQPVIGLFYKFYLGIKDREEFLDDCFISHVVSLFRSRL